MHRTQFRLRASPLLACLIVSTHAAAGVAAALAVPGMPGIALALAFPALGAAAAWARALHLSATSVRALQVEGSRAFLEMRGGRLLPVEVAPRCYVSRHLLTLVVRRPGHRAVLVTRDMLEPEAFRALRLWALWRKLPAAAPRVPVASGPLSA